MKNAMLKKKHLYCLILFNIIAFCVLLVVAVGTWDTPELITVPTVNADSGEIIPSKQVLLYNSVIKLPVTENDEKREFVVFAVIPVTDILGQGLIHLSKELMIYMLLVALAAVTAFLTMFKLRKMYLP